jgi:hypothetical protein
MRRVRLVLFALPLVSLGLAANAGCKKDQPKPSRAARVEQTGGGGGAAAAAAGGTLEAKAFSGTIKGRVTYNGQEPAYLEMKEVDKANQDKGCPAKVMKAGWYLEKSSDKKGVRYAVLVLRPAGGMKMPKLGAEQTKPPAGKEVLTVGQPKCQFEPRVIVLGPEQNVRFINDSEPPQTHDANLSGTSGKMTKTLPPGQDFTYTIDPDDRQPYGVSCNQHSAFMSAFVWKFKHPYAAVTDDEGNFEIHHVPIPTNGKFELWVWHEMLETPGNMKKVKDLDLTDGATLTVNVAIPK